jgi:hypothetical protein
VGAQISGAIKGVVEWVLSLLLFCHVRKSIPHLCRMQHSRHQEWRPGPYQTPDMAVP